MICHSKYSVAVACYTRMLVATYMTGLSSLSEMVIVLFNVAINGLVHSFASWFPGSSHKCQLSNRGPLASRLQFGLGHVSVLWSLVLSYCQCFVIGKEFISKMKSYTLFYEAHNGICMVPYPSSGLRCKAIKANVLVF